MCVFMAGSRYQASSKLIKLKMPMLKKVAYQLKLLAIASPIGTPATDETAKAAITIPVALPRWFSGTTSPMIDSMIA